jgi:hypothetical protein
MAVSGMKPQMCSWCWEEVAVLTRDGEAFCEDCDLEVRQWQEGVSVLTDDLKHTLEQPLKQWLSKHQDKDEELLECVLAYYGQALDNHEARSLISKTVTGVTL